MSRYLKLQSNKDASSIYPYRESKNITPSGIGLKTNVYQSQDTNYLVHTPHAHNTEEKSVSTGYGQTYTFEIPGNSLISDLSLEMGFTNSGSTDYVEYTAHMALKQVDITLPGSFHMKYSGHDLLKLQISYTDDEFKDEIRTLSGAGGTTDSASSGLVQLYGPGCPLGLNKHEDVEIFDARSINKAGNYTITIQFQDADKMVASGSAPSAFSGNVKLRYLAHAVPSFVQTPPDYHYFFPYVSGYVAPVTLVSGSLISSNIKSGLKDGELKDLLIGLVTSTNHSANEYAVGEGIVKLILEANNSEFYRHNSLNQARLESMRNYRNKLGYTAGGGTGYIHKISLTSDNHKIQSAHKIANTGVNVYNLSPNLQIDMGNSATYYLYVTAITKSFIKISNNSSETVYNHKRLNLGLESTS